MEPLKAIIFDMDGVITMTMPYHYRIWAKVFLEAGIHVSKLEVYSREGQKGLTSVLEIFAKNGKKISLADAKGLLKRKEELFKGIPKTPFVPGSRRFIVRMKHQGLKLALVTGTARHEVLTILPKELVGCFDVIVTGSDVKRGKPHPEPYLKALKQLKVAGGEAIVIENAPFGIASARKAGMACVAIQTSLPAKYLKGADKIVHDYKGLNAFLARKYAL